MKSKPDIVAEKPALTVQSRFWLTLGAQSLGGRGRIELLERIEATGSIRQAALAMGMSYKAAWDAVDAMNARAGSLLISRRTGGRNGGGAQLSEEGRRLVAVYKMLEAEHQQLVERLNRKIAELMADP